MDIKEIIHKYLVDNKYDGLANLNIGCGCETDDLFPCSIYGELDQECQPAYKRIYNGTCKENCEDLDCGRDEKSWCMTLQKLEK